MADYVYRDGLLLAAVTPASTNHFHLDHLGTVRAITNTATPPDRTSYHAYYPFGEEATPSTQDSERLRFTGHEVDFNAQGSNPQGDDLTYMHARHHPPLTGRFLQPDPIGGGLFEPQGWNRYTYVLGRPLVHTDPRGLWQSPPPTGMTLTDYGYAVGISVFSGAVRVSQQPTTTPAVIVLDPTNSFWGIIGVAGAPVGPGGREDGKGPEPTGPDSAGEGGSCKSSDEYQACVGSCIEQNRLDWGAVTSFAVVNPLLNVAAGDTGRSGLRPASPCNELAAQARCLANSAIRQPDVQSRGKISR